MVLNVPMGFPGEFEDIVSANDSKLWVSGQTIGPSQRVGGMTVVQRQDYVLSELPALERLGWVVPEARQWYQTNLRGDRRRNLDRLESDLKANRITSEVYALVREAL